MGRNMHPVTFLTFVLDQSNKERAKGNTIINYDTLKNEVPNEFIRNIKETPAGRVSPNREKSPLQSRPKGRQNHFHHRFHLRLRGNSTIPFADMPVLTSIQIFMGYKIAQVRGIRMSEEGVWEILKAIGGAVGLGFAA